MTQAPEMEKAVEQAPIYVASRASTGHDAMWVSYRENNYNIVSTWIDEAGPGQTVDFGELWQRIISEIAAANVIVLYAEPDDFPLKGALIEVGIALGMGKPVIVCLPDVKLDGRTHRPIGSWIECKSVTRIDDINAAMRRASIAPSLSLSGRREDIAKIIDEWAWRIYLSDDQDPKPTEMIERWNEALAKADRILALPAAPLVAEKQTEAK